MPAKVRAGVTPRTQADKPVGEWNEFEITLKGDRLTVVLNGTTVIEDAELPGIPDKGPIALAAPRRLPGRQVPRSAQPRPVPQHPDQAAPEDGHALGPPPPLPDLRPRRLLRQLAGPPRHAPFPPARATRSSRPSSPASGGPGATSMRRRWTSRNRSNNICVRKTLSQGNRGGCLTPERNMAEGLVPMRSVGTSDLIPLPQCQESSGNVSIEGCWPTCLSPSHRKSPIIPLTTWCARRSRVEN